MLQDLTRIFTTPSVAVILLLALAFDFSNGWHDTANSIATIVGTKVMKPFQAVAWAAFWNFVSAWCFGAAVANTVAKWVHPAHITPSVIAAGLIGAIAWNILTWWKGLPSSSSHALLGAFAGAALLHARSIHQVVRLDKAAIVVLFLFISPLAGMILGHTLARLVRRLAPQQEGPGAIVAQLATSAVYSLGHGTNDAQKTVGIIAALFYATIWQDQRAAFEAGTATFPFWIVIVCYAAIAAGTLSGGWRIVHTLAHGITGDLRPRAGACAETAAAVSLLTAAALGVPVSTTHAITGALVGVGLEDRTKGVVWQTMKRIFIGWLLTIPASAALAALALLVISRFT